MELLRQRAAHRVVNGRRVRPAAVAEPGRGARLPQVSDRRTQLLDATVAVIARRGVRGLRVQEVASEVGVSVALIYHYFGNREGLLAAALQSVSDTAARYAEPPGFGTPRARLIARLHGEFRDEGTVRTNSAAWGELRWASVFDAGLRPPVERLTGEWVSEIAELVSAVAEDEGARGVDATATAEVLVALTEGLSNKWLSDAVTAQEAKDLMSLAIAGLVPGQPLVRGRG